MVEVFSTYANLFLTPTHFVRFVITARHVITVVSSAGN